MKGSFQRILSHRFFSRRTELNRPVQIVAWWELRRIPYNLIVGAVGIIACLALSLVPSAMFPGGGGSPVLELLAVIAYGICANVFYTGGWICELATRAVWKERAGSFGEISFTWGLLFSIALTLLPAVILVLISIFHRA